MSTPDDKDRQRMSTPQPLPYETGAPNDPRWTEAVYEALVDGSVSATLATSSGIRTARVAGPCPRCRHDLDSSQVLDAVTGEGSAVRAPSAEVTYVTVVARCECGAHHQGRPDGTTSGCGINFLVDIAAD
jgi:hypothetical protein